jgi:hypothetical protein
MPTRPKLRVRMPLRRAKPANPAGRPDKETITHRCRTKQSIGFLPTWMWLLKVLHIASVVAGSCLNTAIATW